MAESKYDKYMVKVNREGRTGPGAILMSNELVPGSNIFIMYNWIWKMPEPNLIHASLESHDYDEIILNIGTDPHHPEYLGGEIEGYMGDERQIIKTTTALYIPRNVAHGRVTWKSFEKPHIQMAIKLSGNIERIGPR